MIPRKRGFSKDQASSSGIFQLHPSPDISYHAPSVSILWHNPAASITIHTRPSSPILIHQRLSSVIHPHPPSSIIIHHHPSSSIIHHHPSPSISIHHHPSSIIVPGHPLSSYIVHHRSFSSIISHHQASSTIIHQHSHRHPPSYIIHHHTSSMIINEDEASVMIEAKTNCATWGGPSVNGGPSMASYDHSPDRRYHYHRFYSTFERSNVPPYFLLIIKSDDGTQTFDRSSTLVFYLHQGYFSGRTGGRTFPKVIRITDLFRSNALPVSGKRHFPKTLTNVFKRRLL